MVLVVCSFIGVELYWWVGDIERIPSTIDYFINTLEEAFEEFSRVVLQDKASGLKSRTKTPFIGGIGIGDHRTDLTYNSNDTGNADIPLLSTADSEISLTRSDVLEIYHDQNVERRFQNFESFVIRMAKSQDLVKTIFARRLLRFFNLVVVQTVIYLVYLIPSHQLSEFNCPLPDSYRRTDAHGHTQETVSAIYSGVTHRTVHGYRLTIATSESLRNFGLFFISL